MVSKHASILMYNACAMTLYNHTQSIINTGCPSVVRMDCETENSLVAAVQYAFREHHYDCFAGEKSFQYGTSPSNIVCCELTVL